MFKLALVILSLLIPSSALTFVPGSIKISGEKGCEIASEALYVALDIDISCSYELDPQDIDVYRSNFVIAVVHTKEDQLFTLGFVFTAIAPVARYVPTKTAGVVISIPKHAMKSTYFSLEQVNSCVKFKDDYGTVMCIARLLDK